MWILLSLAWASEIKAPSPPPGDGVTPAPPLVPLAPAVGGAPPEPAPPIQADREWEVLAAPAGPDWESLRAAYQAAGEKLGTWKLSVAGAEIDGVWLQQIAQASPGEPFTRVVREGLSRPIDLVDLLYYLDDVLVAGEAGRRGEAFSLPMGRARSAGVLVHPDDVFSTKPKPRNYPDKPEIAVDEPPPQESFPEAKDGEILGPNWTMRYKSPESRAQMFETLAAKRPQATFSSRIAALVSQLEQQGAEVYLTSFLRYRERGYLMWGAHLLRSCTTETCVRTALTKLKTANSSWAHVPIKWSNPAGWQATQESARQMADAYDVVFATEKGARFSNHYDGTAADFVAMGLPRSLSLVAPNGEQRTFDLSGADQPRDLSLTPEVIDWIEANFGLHKLNSDHPHWDDTQTEDVPD
jgi:hypothetical protein